MTQRTVTIVGVLCLLVLFPAVANSAEHEETKESIAKVIDDSIGWFKTKDFDLLFNTIADDPDLFMFQPGSTGTIHGIDAFRELSAIWKDPDTTYLSHETRDLRIHISQSGRVAWFSAILDDCGVYKGQTGCWKDARWTGVLENSDAGWVIMQMHFSFAADKVKEELRKSDSPSVEEGTLEINGTSLFYKTMGSGDPIVVLHGGPGFDHRQFLPYIWELASEHKVILYDQRGTGLSSGPVDADSISIETFISDLEAIREAFGIEKMNLLGHSWGGILAMHYSLRHQERLKSLILCSTAATEESFSVMRATYEADRLPADAELLEEIYSSDEYKSESPEAIEKFWRVFFKPYFADQSLVSGLDLQFTENTIKNSSAVAGYLLKSIAGFDLHEDLKTIAVPTLILHGDSDPMPAEYAERIHHSIEGSHLVIAKESGHWLFVDATETFISSILEFLSTTAATR